MEGSMDGKWSKQNPKAFLGFLFFVVCLCFVGKKKEESETDRRKQKKANQSKGKNKKGWKVQLKNAK